MELVVELVVDLVEWGDLGRESVESVELVGLGLDLVWDLGLEREEME